MENFPDTFAVRLAANRTFCVYTRVGVARKLPDKEEAALRAIRIFSRR